MMPVSIHSDSAHHTLNHASYTLLREKIYTPNFKKYNLLSLITLELVIHYTFYIHQHHKKINKKNTQQKYQHSRVIPSNIFEHPRYIFHYAPHDTSNKLKNIIKFEHFANKINRK